VAFGLKPKIHFNFMDSRKMTGRVPPVLARAIAGEHVVTQQDIETMALRFCTQVFGGKHERCGGAARPGCPFWARALIAARVALCGSEQVA